MNMAMTRSLIIAAQIAVAAVPLASASIAAELDPAGHHFQDACAAGTKFDNTTSEQARAKIAAAGYWNVANLKKGCDNYWHASAERNGQDMLVLMSPDGHIVREID